jgi:putative ABC transport system permease protein
MVLERTREIGILKALGSSRVSILGLIEAEASMIACLGAALGLLLTFSMVFILRYWAPTMRVSITFGWVVRAILLAVVASGFGALYPGYRAARADPVEALSYE